MYLFVWNSSLWRQSCWNWWSFRYHTWRQYCIFFWAWEGFGDSGLGYCIKKHEGQIMLCWSFFCLLSLGSKIPFAYSFLARSTRLGRLQNSLASQNMPMAVQDLLQMSHLSKHHHSCPWNNFILPWMLQSCWAIILLCHGHVGNSYPTDYWEMSAKLNLHFWCSATLIFEVELVACRPRKGSSLGSVSEERARLE